MIASLIGVPQEWMLWSFDEQMGGPINYVQCTAFGRVIATISTETMQHATVGPEIG